MVPVAPVGVIAVLRFIGIVSVSVSVVAVIAFSSVRGEIVVVA